MSSSEKELELTASGPTKEDVLASLAYSLVAYLNMLDMVRWEELDDGWEGTLPVFAEQDDEYAGTTH